MSITRFWIVKSTRSGVTINPVNFSVKDAREKSPWLNPNEFKNLIIENYNIDSDIVAKNFLIKRIKNNQLELTINVISSGTKPNGWSCSFYGTFDETLARSLYKNEIQRVQTQYMLIF